MKSVRLATLTRVLGSTEDVPLTDRQKRLLRKPNKLKIKMSVMPRLITQK